MATTLIGMTQAKWNALPPADREGLRDSSDLTPQLIGLEGQRVEVVSIHGDTRRFIVGKSTGWKPCHLEVKTRRSLGGGPASREYRSVRVVNANPRGTA